MLLYLNTASKPEYYNVAARNLARAEQEARQVTLFSEFEEEAVAV